MSLIILNSKEQPNPASFNNHFSREVVIEPNSEVCVQKLIHFREGENIIVTNNTNRLYFRLGNTQNNAKRLVLLETGSYTLTEYLDHLQKKLNDATQQQNYTWTVTSDTTTEPFLQILISFASVAPPTLSGGTWSDFIDDTDVFEIRNNDTDNNASTIIPKFETPVDSQDLAISTTAFMRRGMLLHFGNYVSTDIALMNLTNPSDQQLRFPFLTIGAVRDLFSEPTEDTKTDFDPEKQDISIYLSDTGECVIEKIVLDAGRNRNIVELARISQANMTTILGLTGTTSDYISKRLRFTITFIGTSRRVVIQIQVSSDFGNNYSDVADATAGIITSDTFSGQSFTSILFQDVNLFETKNAPYIPTLTVESGGGGSLQDTPKTNGNPDLQSDGAGFVTPSGIYIQVVDFTAPNLYTLEIYDATNTLISTVNLTGKIALGEDRNVFDFEAVPPATASGTFTYDPENDDLVQDITGVGIRTFNSVTKLNYIRVDPQYLVIGQFNPFQRDSITQANLLGKTKTRHLLDLEATTHDGNTDDGVAVGNDLSKECLLFLRRLTQTDISSSGGKITQAEVNDPSQSGNIGSTIGSSTNFKLTPASTGAEVFRSDRAIQRSSKETFLHVAIPELSGVRSYEGGRSDVAKTIAVIPREELQVEDDPEKANRFSFSAPFQNWVKINNAKHLYLNQLSCEIRSPDGKLIEGMLPSTTLVVKIRESPEQVEMKKSRELVRQVIDSGRILSRDITNVSS